MKEVQEKIHKFFSSFCEENPLALGVNKQFQANLEPADTCIQTGFIVISSLPAHHLNETVRATMPSIALQLFQPHRHMCIGVSRASRVFSILLPSIIPASIIHACSCGSWVS